MTSNKMMVYISKGAIFNGTFYVDLLIHVGVFCCECYLSPKTIKIKTSKTKFNNDQPRSGKEKDLWLETLFRDYS